MTTDLRCPLCSGRLQLHDNIIVSESVHPGYHNPATALPRRERVTDSLACTGCEFMIDLRHADGRQKDADTLKAELTAIVQEAGLL